MLQNNTGRLHIQKGWKTCFEQFCSHHPRLEWRFVQHCSCNSWFSSRSCRQVFILYQKYRKIFLGILYKICKYGRLRQPTLWPFGFDFDNLCNEYKWAFWNDIDGWFLSRSCRQVFILVRKYRKQNCWIGIWKYGHLWRPISIPFWYERFSLCLSKG